MGRDLPTGAPVVPVPRCSVVALVVSWNRPAELRRCLQSLAEQVIPEWVDFSVLLIDNGSTADIPGVVREACKSLPAIEAWGLDRNHGGAVARNVALEKTQADYLLLIDSDAWLESRDALARWAERLRGNPRLGAVGGTIWADAAHSRPPFMIGAYLTRNLHCDLPRWRRDHEAPHFVSSCCAMWRRSSVARVDGFEAWYVHGIEDVDACMLMAKQDSLEILPDVFAVHEMSPESRARPVDDFDAVFDYLEWTRPYLHLRLHGWWRTARAAAGWLVAFDEFHDAYKVPLRWDHRLRAHFLYPAWHLVAWPFRRLGARIRGPRALPRATRINLA